MDTTESHSAARPLDRLGTIASSLCVVHCLTAALVPIVPALLGLGALLGHEAEWGFTLLASAIALGAAFFAIRARGFGWAAALLIGGVVALVAARFMEEAGLGALGTALGIGAGLTLVIGHLGNLRSMRDGTPAKAQS